MKKILFTITALILGYIIGMQITDVEAGVEFGNGQKNDEFHISDEKSYGLTPELFPSVEEMLKVENIVFLNTTPIDFREKSHDFGVEVNEWFYSEGDSIKISLRGEPGTEHMFKTISPIGDKELHFVTFDESGFAEYTTGISPYHEEGTYVFMLFHPNGKYDFTYFFVGDDFKFQLPSCGIEL